MTREDWSKAADLINILREAGQEVPDELVKMSERFAAWKERKDEERGRNAMDMGRGGGGGGGSGRGCFKVRLSSFLFLFASFDMICCFQCGEEGHFSRECPSGGGASGGGSSFGQRGGAGGGGRGCHKVGVFLLLLYLPFVT